MRIADTTLFFTPGSGGVRTYLESKRRSLLRRDGMEHRLLIPGARVEIDGDIVRMPAIPLPLAPGYRFPVRVGLWADTLAGMMPDVIEAGDPYTPAWAAQAAARQLDVPAIGFYHSDLMSLIHHRVTRFLDEGTRWYLNRLYRGFDRVLTPSSVMAERLTDCGVQNVHVQPLGVDLETFNPKHANPDCRRRLGLGDDTHLLVFAGRGVREKHIPVLLKAARDLGPKWHLLLIGTGMPHDVPDNVSVIHHFCPAEEVAEWMASADALLHAGDQETFGLVALEAMASGLPVVAVRAGALPEVVPESCGRFARANDGVDMARAVRDLFEEGAAEVGRRARAHVEQSHSWDCVVDSLLGHYRAALGSHAAPLLTRTHERYP